MRAARDENAFAYRFLLAACACILHKYTLQLTTALSSTWFIVLLIHCCIYCIHCWNYELLNQAKQAEWMKSSDIVALIIPIRFSLPPTSCCVSGWMSCGQWPSTDRQIITLRWVCQASGRESWEGEKGRQRHQFIINAKPKPVSECSAVCLGISHPPLFTIFFILQSAALTSLEDIMVPCHQESPLLHRQSFIHGGIALLFHSVCACARDNVTRTLRRCGGRRL